MVMMAIAPSRSVNTVMSRAPSRRSPAKMIDEGELFPAVVRAHAARINIKINLVQDRAGDRPKQSAVVIEEATVTESGVERVVLLELGRSFTMLA